MLLCAASGWLMLGLVAAAHAEPAGPARVLNWTGPARAWLDSPGGSLEFGVEVGPEPGRVTIINADERIDVPVVNDDGTTLTLRFDDYDAAITATPVEGSEGRELVGEWARRRGPGGSDREFVRLPFRLNARGWCPVDADLGGGMQTARELVNHPRWRVVFDDDPDPAVLVLTPRPRRGAPPTELMRGTILTTTGDYRYLTPTVGPSTLTLSCFDGSHAFLLVAKLQPDGSLAGDFWSGAWGHSMWTAKPDPTAALPDGFGIARVQDGVDLDGLSYPDSTGRERRLGDPAFAGTCRIIEVFGTWCPNCRDATALLVEYQKRYGPRGLSVVGLAFEVTGDRDRDLNQLRVYAARHKVSYPLLLGGTTDKSAAHRAFPVLDKLHAYPTLLFVDAAGRVRSVYSGFSGPATGEEHDRLKARFEKLIESMLSE